MAGPTAVVSVPEVRLVKSRLNDASRRCKEWQRAIGDIPRHARHQVLKDLSDCKREYMTGKRRRGWRCYGVSQMVTTLHLSPLGEVFCAAFRVAGGPLKVSG